MPKAAPAMSSDFFNGAEDWQNGHNESCRIMNSQILILYAQMGTTHFL